MCYFCNRDDEGPNPFNEIHIKSSDRFFGPDVIGYIVDGKKYDPKDVMVVLDADKVDVEAAIDYNEYTVLREPFPGETGWKKE